MLTHNTLDHPIPTVVEASRHICEEVRLLLSSLRRGPPDIAYGELAQNLQYLRQMVRYQFLDKSPQQQPSSTTTLPSTPHHQPPPPPTPPTPASTDTHPPDNPIPPPSVGPYADPFLQVVTNPHASGPHTLVALRSLHRLLLRRTLLPLHDTTLPSPSSNNIFYVPLEPLISLTLSCKFEQTDPGADEAVEMAIADLLALVLVLDDSPSAISPQRLMDAFHSVFVTRNTFVHSPALCYHFEEVLVTMCRGCFERRSGAGPMILGFLAQQLLHTPLEHGGGGGSGAGGGVTVVGGGSVVGGGVQEAQLAHDATRVLALRLSRECLRRGWGDDSPHNDVYGGGDDEKGCGGALLQWEEREGSEVLRVVQDELCLSLLLLGQAFLDDDSVGIGPHAPVVGEEHVLNPEVLSEICSTISLLWSLGDLRARLVPQFEALFAGFFQRGLILLRRRVIPIDSTGYMSNLVFDAQMEIILQTLEDVMSLQDDSGGALEILYGMYDCKSNRSDVATGLFVELCRCCGGMVGEEGDILHDAASVPIEGDDGEVYIQRQLPSHLKELCAEALVGGVKCLFYDGGVAKCGDDAIVPKTNSNAHSMSSKSEESSAESLRKIKQNKRLMKHGAQIFNKNSTEGILYLSEHGVLPFSPSPMDVARFLREGLVVGLDKSSVGEYLGDVGKGPVPKKNPHNFERDWFHKETLAAYCSLFRFENQSLLDGLRMFLSSFRLPGEAQQIDRILQAFAESCSQQCQEAATAKSFFSHDPKKAADAAYLLAFSIIMLNTDLHNDNIRPDKKMSMDAFVKNNTNYGSDITDEGKDLPTPYLQSIYESIREEELRTEGEGADGTMTVERWKDVLRGVCGTAGLGSHKREMTSLPPTVLKSLVVDSIYRPLLGAVAGLFNVNEDGSPRLDVMNNDYGGGGGRSARVEAMPATTASRLGIDLSVEFLSGARALGCRGAFQEFFVGVCRYSGLLLYRQKTVSRMSSFVRSVPRQSAVLVGIQTARKAGDDIGDVGWRCVWGMIFELRDLKLLGGGRRRGILAESDADLLTPETRRQWTNKLLKGGVSGGGNRHSLRAGGGGVMDGGKGGKGVSSVFVAMSRALFGSEDLKIDDPSVDSPMAARAKIRTIHGKENLLLWHDLAPSDEEEEYVDADIAVESTSYPEFEDGGASAHHHHSHHLLGTFAQTPGTAFENRLLHEDDEYHSTINGGGGPGSMMDSRSLPSQRARVRRRLVDVCDFAGLVSESRYFTNAGILNLVEALKGMIENSNDNDDSRRNLQSNLDMKKKKRIKRRSIGFGKVDKSDNEEPQQQNTDAPQSDDVAETIVLSPASEALAEILICEISIKNKDRFATIWEHSLKEHYTQRLSTPDAVKSFSASSYSKPVHSSQALILSTASSSHHPTESHTINPGIEKCITGLIRLTITMVKKDALAPPLLSSISLLHPPVSRHPFASTQMSKHIAEGLWRIVQNGESTLPKLSSEGWDGLLGLVDWCAGQGGAVVKTGAKRGGLSDDDPALQSFRSLHLALHSREIREAIPFGVVRCIASLIKAGEKGRCAKLCIAGLDLLLMWHNRLEGHVKDGPDGEWVVSWCCVLDEMATAAETSSFPSVRQHALTMLTDAIVDRHGRAVMEEKLREIVSETCIPLAGRRIKDLLGIADVDDIWEEVMIELEVCISLIFKPFLHHLKNLIGDKKQFVTIWKSLLDAMSLLLGDKDADTAKQDDDEADGQPTDTDASGNMTMDRLLLTTQELASEHLRNAIMVLVACGVLEGDGQEVITGYDDIDNDIDEDSYSSSHIGRITWGAIEKMTFCTKFIDEWKKSATVNFDEHQRNQLLNDVGGAVVGGGTAAGGVKGMEGQGNLVDELTISRE